MTLSSQKISRKLIATTLTVALAGCAAMQKDEVEQTEQTLAAAGFTMKLADTPQKLANLQTMAQHKLVPHQHPDGQLRYLYADASDCKCLYAGDQAAYQDYQRMTRQQQLANEQEMTAEMNQMNWGMWGW